MEADRIRLKPFVIACAGMFVLEGAAGVLIGLGWSYPMAVLGLVRVAEAGLMLWVFRRWGRGVSDLGLARDQIPAGLKQGIIWSLGFGILVLIGFGVLLLMGQNPLKLLYVRLPSDPIERFWYLLVGGIIAPVAEELFFRGVLYGYFRRWGIFLALAASSLLFVSAHSTGGFPVTQTVGGVLFALAYEFEGTLMTPITIHVSGNLALFSFSFFG
ncbi:MAG: CPBP family intramembrane glutamic endopeptidase [Thermodesulfobacteriota bacterium]